MSSVALGPVGAWIGAFTVAPAAEARPAAREIEELGYDTVSYTHLTLPTICSV